VSGLLYKIKFFFFKEKLKSGQDLKWNMVLWVPFHYF
jgi:hypothetical protein